MTLDTFPLLFWIAFGFLLLCLWFRSQRKKQERVLSLREQYALKMRDPRWIEFSREFRRGRQCYICGKRKVDTHHIDYLVDHNGCMVEPWDEVYLHLNMLRAVCREHHQQERKARWLQLERVA